MIAWWWLLVMLAVLIAVAAVLHRDVREALSIIACAVAGLVLAPLVLLLDRVLGCGAIPIKARTVEAFARQRSAAGEPAWLFFTRGRGVLLLRKWDLGSNRVRVQVGVSPEWRRDR